MSVKVGRVREYWAGQSVLIPNVFRVLSQVEEEGRCLLEFQDLSSKIVLVQGTGTRVGSELEEGTPLRKGRTSERKRPRRRESLTARCFNTSKACAVRKSIA